MPTNAEIVVAIEESSPNIYKIHLVQLFCRMDKI